jgi:transposase-like protein
MAGRKRRQYDDKFRASTVVMLQSEGYPHKPGALTYVAKHVGVPAMTISRWFKASNNPPPHELVTEKKEELADVFERVAYKYLRHAESEDVIDAVAGNAAVVTAATAVDKMRLLRGLPTEIVQVLPGLVAAMQDAGLSPADVFNNMLARLDAQARKVSSNTRED